MDSGELNAWKSGGQGEPAPEDGHRRAGNRTFEEVLTARFGRRAVLGGAVGAAFAGALAPMSGFFAPPALAARASAPSLDFDAIPTSGADAVKVAAGYTARPIIPWGTPITGDYPAYRDGGRNSGAEQEQQVGMHHDGMSYFPMTAGDSAHGLLSINHEFISPAVLHPGGPTWENGVRTVPGEVRKEVAAHGLSVIEIARNQDGGWEVVRGRYNRRITAGTPMALTGPVRGSDHVRTRYSPGGTMTRGTFFNCSNGRTPWNTYLTCEENWARYFFNSDPEPPREHTRYGVPAARGSYGWGTVDNIDAFRRFNASTRAGDPREDYRNEPNCHGWVVEVDPFDPESTPVKRTALGRFAHECAVMAPSREGRPVVAYMGDDARFEYLYKFVSSGVYRAGGDNRALLADGRLYVARFNDDGSGDWLALQFGENGLTPENGFADQADVLVNTRLAADHVGATPMDRPEWVAVHPETLTVFATLTNNLGRREPNAANPRAANPYGHIIRWDEAGAEPWATSFNWDIFVLAGPAGEGRVFSGGGDAPLTEDNMFSCPDGLWFDNAGVLWIETDGNLTGGNDMLLAAVAETGDIRRFLTGVPGCEITGLTGTPDRRTLFCNIQHPGGNDPQGSVFPDGEGHRPRSATLAITRDDGGPVVGGRP